MPSAGKARTVAVFTWLAALLLPAGAGHTQQRYIEFLARPSSCVVGHSFVQIGTITRRGALRADATIGLYPVAYPRTDRAALVNAPGRITRTSADRRDQATARDRVTVSETTYAKALAHARRMRVEWRRYDLATENCNKVLFEFADRLGLEVRHDMHTDARAARAFCVGDDRGRRSCLCSSAWRAEPASVCPGHRQRSEAK